MAIFHKAKLEIALASLFTICFLAYAMAIEVRELGLFTTGQKSNSQEQEEIPETEEQVRRRKVEFREAQEEPFGIQGHKEESAVQDSGQAPPLEVQGLLWGGDLPQAVINEKIVKVGDIVDGAKVLSIEKKGVTVFFEGRQYTITMPTLSEQSASSKKEGG
jgi:hypothetical protein